MAVDYKIIASGSKGNAVIVDKLLFDCGVPFKNLKEHLYDIKYLVITHLHLDHLNKSTYKRIRKEFPHIKTIGNYEVHQEVEVDHISNSGYGIDLEHTTLIPFDCIHDVVTHGYTFNINNKSIIYATDTNNLLKAPVMDYDYFFIESNHSESKIEECRQLHGYGYNPYLESQRHLSTEKAREFYYQNRRSEDSKFIELHKSKRFY